MIIIFALVLVTTVQSYPAGQILYSKDLSNSVDEVYGSYFTLSDNRKDNNEVNNHPYSQPYLNKMIIPPPSPQQSEDLAKSEPESRRVERTAYLHIQTKQKDKRYASYLTLCHFKICNMGRKRTTRYFHVISSLDNGT
ncbi:hypothetical protein ILUMI_20605 [Ignelater luminosus]|uniref:Uncharacterized protein n=1 Tax=Ignelater luminosus TaxID=2038154 RepID=A0A8K0G247_IGNLU|nr:hypothetical protein ILUMI_20605 [Ignelater luminosus]